MLSDKLNAAAYMSTEEAVIGMEKGLKHNPRHYFIKASRRNAHPTGQRFVQGMLHFLLGLGPLQIVLSGARGWHRKVCMGMLTILITA